MKHVMVILKGHDDKPVEFTRAAAGQIPYIADMLSSEGRDEYYAVFADETQLRLIADAYKAKGDSQSFEPTKETIQVKDVRFPLPPFLGYTWTNDRLSQFFYSLSPADIRLLITVSDTMCDWKLRDVTIKFMYMRMVVNDASFDLFFPSISAWQLRAIKGVYIKEFNESATSVARSDCYDLHDSSDSD